MSLSHSGGYVKRTAQGRVLTPKVGKFLVSGMVNHPFPTRWNSCKAELFFKKGKRCLNDEAYKMRGSSQRNFQLIQSQFNVSTISSGHGMILPEAFARYTLTNSYPVSDIGCTEKFPLFRNDPAQAPIPLCIPESQIRRIAPLCRRALNNLRSKA